MTTQAETKSEPESKEPKAADDKTYRLPGEIAAALATGRPELMTSLISGLRTGKTRLKPEVMATVVDLLKDTINDKIKLQDELAEERTSKAELVARQQRAMATLNGEEDDE